MFDIPLMFITSIVCTLSGPPFTPRHCYIVDGFVLNSRSTFNNAVVTEVLLNIPLNISLFLYDSSADALMYQ